MTCVGSQSAMGRLLGVSQAAVWKWLNTKVALPPEHVLKVERETGISRHDLNPEIYPRAAAYPALPVPIADESVASMEPNR